MYKIRRLIRFIKFLLFGMNRLLPYMKDIGMEVLNPMINANAEVFSEVVMAKMIIALKEKMIDEEREEELKRAYVDIVEGFAFFIENEDKKWFSILSRLIHGRSTYEYYSYAARQYKPFFIGVQHANQ